MKKRSVKRRIFLSNALMVLATLVIFLVINAAVIKIYAESVEQDFRDSVSSWDKMDEDEMEDMLDDYTVRRNEFIVLFLVDGVLCIAGLLLMSQIFTGRLVRHIMEPLNALDEAAARIRENDLTQEIAYTGEVEFENVCDSFNDMQRHILAEQEKNRKYEKARTDMIAGISHDLRTPLTAIRGSIKGLLDGGAKTPKMQEKFLETAYRRTGDMDVLLKQLFLLSRMETGNAPLDIQTVEIGSFIRNYVSAKQALTGQENLEIHDDTEEITAGVLADPEQLMRIFDNLFENSRKYADVSPLRIHLSVKKLSNQVEIRFSDNGAGVPKEKLPYLFDEFYRADESRNKKEGNGLGLYIVKYLVEAMGGSVRAESENGFAVFITLRESAAEDRKEQ